MKKTPPPVGSAFEPLEDRALPSTFGVPWADPGHVTLSFVPDGTATPRGAATTSQTLVGAAAQREVLRAFQTWAAAANINVGLVRDGGQPLGTAGAPQGDARFGDVRVAAAPLSGAALASALPFGFTGTTYGGDVLFNSAARFSAAGDPTAYDLYSIALHEAGHVFGLDHDEHDDSTMAAGYAAHAGLSADALADIRALYGARTPDAFDAAGGNDTRASASAMRQSGLVGRLVADADLTTTADADFYKFATLPTLGLTGVTLRLQAAGLSLLTARVTVYDSAGRVVAAAAATDPANNDLTLRFTNGVFGGTYFARVDGATEDVFGVGAYRLTVDTVDLDYLPVPLLGTLLNPVLDLGLNDTLASATDLTGLLSGPADARFDATYRGAVETRSDVDTYKLRAPAGAGPVALNVMAWATDAAGLNPRVRVYDAAGVAVPFRVLANDAGLFSVEVRNATPGATYYVAVAARTPNGGNAVGGYFLGADFNRFDAPVYTAAGAGTIAAGATTAGTLTVRKAGIFQFALAADALGGAGGVVTLTVLDAAGRVVFALDAAAGAPLTTAARYLPVGTYTLRYTTRGTGTAAPGPLGFGLYLLQLSDDVGPYASQTTTQAPPPADGPTSSGTTTTTTQSAPPPADGGSTSGSGSGTWTSTSDGYTYDSYSTSRATGTPYYY